MKWQRRLFVLAGILTILGAFIYISWPVSHIPPYDANLVRLAESDLQGYCAGRTFWDSGGMGNKDIAAQCRTAYAQKKSDKPDMQVVPKAFCQAIVDSGWQDGTRADCITILTDNQYWPTYDGALSASWNRARPYPAKIVAFSAPAKGSSSRTGDHTGNSRDGSSSRSTGWPIP